jgi:hypothetical protein
MKDQRVKGSTSVILEIFIQDNSVTTGAGLTGLVHNSAGLTCYYHRNTAAAAVAVTLADMTVGTFTSSGFKAVDGTNMPGVYQLCIPDAAFATGADSVSVLLKGATNMAPVVLEIRLTGVDFANASIDANVVALGGGVQSLTDLKDFADDGYDPSTNKIAGVVTTDAVTVVNGLANNVITTAAINDGAFTAAKFADAFLTAAKIATDAITAAKIAADALTSAKIADGALTAAKFASGAFDAVWSVASRLLTAGTNIVLAKGTGVTGFNDLSAAQVNSEVDAALVDVRLDELLAADSDIDGAAPPTVGSVFHELLSKTAGSFTYDQTTDSLEAIRDRGDAAWITATGFSTLTQADIRTALGMSSANLDTQLGNILSAIPSAATIATTVWDKATSALSTAGSIGKLLVDNINATISSRSSHSAADVWAVATRLLTAGTNIVLAKGTGVTGFNDLSASQVNAEVVDALATDTYAEPGQGAPGATISLAAKINYLFKAWRNTYTQTSDTYKLYNDAGDTVDQKATISDDGTVFTHAEVVSGP